MVMGLYLVGLYDHRQVHVVLAVRARPQIIEPFKQGRSLLPLLLFEDLLVQKEGPQMVIGLLIPPCQEPIVKAIRLSDIALGVVAIADLVESV